jgi:hypothetical protein
MSGAAAPHAPHAMQVSLSTIVYFAMKKNLPVNNKNYASLFPFSFMETNYSFLL